MSHESAVLVYGVEGTDAVMPCASITHQLAQTRDRISNHPLVMSRCLSDERANLRSFHSQFIIQIKLVKTEFGVWGPGVRGF